MRMDVQRKLRQALGSVKDSVSIGKAMTHAFTHQRKDLSDIEVALVRATAHDNGPVRDKYMHHLLFLVSNCSGSIPFLAEHISRRLSRTRDPLLALKTLLLIHRLLRGGSRYFEQQLRASHTSGHLQLQMKLVSTDTPSLSFLGSYVAYLQERMGWFINPSGKLEPVVEIQSYEEKSIHMAFRRLPKCQAFIDSVLSFSPILSMSMPWDDHRLVQAAITNTLKECFQVYATFQEGIAALVNMFFELTEPARALACDILKRASQQTENLHEFFDKCKLLTYPNRNLEYPCVEIITMEYVTALQQCLGHSSHQQQRKRDQEAGTLQTKISMVWVRFEEELYNKSHGPAKTLSNVTSTHDSSFRSSHYIQSCTK